MATFSQFLRHSAKHPPKQITWVCGSEPVLVEEVVQHVRTALSPEPWNLTCLSAGEDSERDIWTALDQHPLGGSVRLVIVRHADRLQNWSRFIDFVEHRTKNPKTFVIMVSDEPTVPKTEVSFQDRRRGEKPQPLPHIACLTSRGYVVECRQFTTSTTPAALSWVLSKASMRESVARHLLVRAGWDLRLVRDTCLKLAAFPGESSIAVVNTVLSEQPIDELSDALLALDRKTAFLAARSVPSGEVGRLIGLLDSKLDTAGMVHDMQNAHRTSGEIAKALGAQAFLLPDLLKVSKHYNVKRRVAIRRVLAIADEAHRSGQTTGVLETVISLW